MNIEHSIMDDTITKIPTLDKNAYIMIFERILFELGIMRSSLEKETNEHIKQIQTLKKAITQMQHNFYVIFSNLDDD